MVRNAPLTIALLATAETTAGTIFGLYDLFSSAGRDKVYRHSLDREVFALFSKQPVWP
jgi:hypothetical protein